MSEDDLVAPIDSVAIVIGSKRRRKHRYCVVQLFKVVKGQLRKIDPELKRLRQNARVKRVVKPKTAIMVLHEMHPDIVFKIDEVATNKTSIYRVHFELNGKPYSGEGFSKSAAKQNACENALKSLLMEKIAKEQEEEKKAEKMDVDEDAPRTPAVDDFPWGKLAGFALQKLVDSALNKSNDAPVYVPAPVIPNPNQYGGHQTFTQNPNHVSFSNFTGGYPHPNNFRQKEPVYQPVQLLRKPAAPRKKFPDNPLEYNPVALFNQTWPHAEPLFDTRTNPEGKIEHTAVLKLEGFQFSSAGKSKKDAKTEIAKAVISTLKGVKYPDGFNSSVVKA